MIPTAAAVTNTMPSIQVIATKGCFNCSNHATKGAGPGRPADSMGNREDTWRRGGWLCSTKSMVTCVLGDTHKSKGILRPLRSPALAVGRSVVRPSLSFKGREIIFESANQRETAPHCSVVVLSFGGKSNQVERSL